MQRLRFLSPLTGASVREIGSRLRLTVRGDGERPSEGHADVLKLRIDACQMRIDPGLPIRIKSELFTHPRNLFAWVR